MGKAILAVVLILGVAIAALILMGARHSPPCVSLGLVGFTNIEGRSYVVLRVTNEGEEAISLESAPWGGRYHCEIETGHGWTNADPRPATGGPTLLLPASNLVLTAHLPAEARQARVGVSYHSATLRQKVAGSTAGRWIPPPLLRLLPGSPDYEYIVWTRPLLSRKPPPNPAQPNANR